MRNKLYQTTLAFAGILQAIALVKEIAQTGHADEIAYQASIYSIFQTSPKESTAVYGGLPGLKRGLEILSRGFDRAETVPRASYTRYLISLFHLQKKILLRSRMQKLLSERIEKTRKQAEYFHLTHPTVIASLADIYLTTISTFKFRIIVWGNQRYLSAPENMNKVRALLLAGIRSVYLWRQVGGSRWQLLFARGKMVEMAKKILREG